MKTMIGLVASLGLAALSATASAQDYSADPSFGSVTLSAGFTPDPHSRNLTAGGSIRAQDRFSSCRGYIANAPDYSVYYTAGSTFPLIFTVDSDRDTTLVINGPDTRWYCDDDGAEEPLNPMVRFNSPQSGRYDIWVGTYSRGSNVPATLFVSEVGEHTRDGSSSWSGSSQSSSSASISLPARYGNRTISGGFLPDPWTMDVTAGGPLRANDAINSNTFCSGYITAEPTVEVRYDGSSDFHIYTSGSADVTLAVNGPDGTWYCNDDGATGANAGVSLTSGTTGTYDIYVGTFSQGERQTRLNISEIAMDYGTGSGSSGGSSSSSSANISLPARYGNRTISGGFLPDPWTMDVTAGGPLRANDAINANTFCSGYITAEPTVEVRYDGSSDFHIYTSGSADVTLAVNGPDGTWYCNDDGASGANAGVSLTSGTTGTYDIYVGTFSQGSQSTRLNISEIAMDYGVNSK
ncbi:hypothetical protein NHF45_13145 [Maricaulaceae bacterium NA33B04]|nr:hypothetical protein [Maricaulaceae bacterium NA33B04]